MLLSVKNRLITMNFMQFFIWGCWLITIGAFWFQTKEWSGESFGAIFSTMGFASLFMPTLTGIIADRWISAQKLYGFLHLLGGVMLFTLPMASSPTMMFWLMLITMIFYMPTISLSITISYSSLLSAGLDLTKEFPPIRVWGTIGFVIALWTVSLLGFEKSAFQFYIAGFASFLLGGYAFSLPDCPPLGKELKKGFINVLGLNAFALFKQYKLAVFFLFAMLLGASLQLTNAYGDTFIHDFEKIDAYKGLLTVKYPAIIMSISQISETLFILFIPFFLKKFGIKKVMLMSMIAWVLRFGLLGLGDPAGGLWMIVLSCIIYGMAFDFFNVSGSLFIETQSDKSIRASVQGLFMMMVNGVGAVLGSIISGILIDRYFLFSDGSKDWQGIWFCFAGYSLVVAILFAILFKHKHDPNLEVKH
jgi:MFS transporter, NHS family, xanthosine permease